MGKNIWEMQFDPLWDELQAHFAHELYPEHKDRAIEEFSTNRLRSYYKSNSFVMRPAVDMIQEGNNLRESGHAAAALVFYTSATELLLKATVLRPVIVGLVHIESLAEGVCAQALAGTGFSRYSKLLSGIFHEIAKIDLEQITREGAARPLLEECARMQDLRNGVIHRGESRIAEEAENANAVAVAVFSQLVQPLLHALGLTVIERGEIREASGVYGKL